MNAPARGTSGQPVMLFTLAWNDALRLRMQQVEVNGHTPAADDVTGPDRWKERSRFFPGIAAAMADQWGPLLSRSEAA